MVITIIEIALICIGKQFTIIPRALDFPPKLSLSIIVKRLLILRTEYPLIIYQHIGIILNEGVSYIFFLVFIRIYPTSIFIMLNYFPYLVIRVIKSVRVAENLTPLNTCPDRHD